MFNVGTYGAYAEKDLKGANALLAAGLYELAGVQAQQCLEKIAKHYILNYVISKDMTSLMKSHKLRRLYAQIPNKSVKDYALSLQDLTDCYFDGRYPSEELYILDEMAARELVALSEKIYNEMCLLIQAAETTGNTDYFTDSRE